MYKPSIVSYRGMGYGEAVVHLAGRFAVNGPQFLALAKDLRRHLRLSEPDPDNHPLFKRLTGFIALFETPEP